MTVTLQYDATLARVQIDADGLGSVDTARVERSTNEVSWTVVRGALEQTVTSGDLLTTYDYEFVDGVENFYRVVTRDELSFVAAGTADTDNNASVTPGVPAGIQDGDLLVLFAAIRNFGVGSVNEPSGWDTLLDMGHNVKVFGKVTTGSESTPTVTFTGGVSNADTAAQMIALRGVDVNTKQSVGDHVPTNGTDVTTPALELGEIWHGGLILYFMEKAGAFTSAALSTGTEISEIHATAGADMTLVWNYRILGPEIEFDNLGEQEYTITGGTTASKFGGIMAFQASETIQSSSITPELDGVWLKSVGRPFLNRPLFCDPHPGTITRDSRSIITPIVGHSLPIGTSAVPTSRRLVIPVITETRDDSAAYNVIIGTGDPLFIHSPMNHPMPTMYVVVDDSVENRPLLSEICNRDWRRFDLPLIEVAAPGASVVGSTSTWQTVIDTYDDWDEVVTDKETWLLLIELVGSVSEVVVP